jgi:hypothetical protein
MLFRRLEYKEAQRLIDYADKHGHDYDIWNAQDLFLGVTDIAEIGVEDKVWIEFDLKNGENNET